MSETPKSPDETPKSPDETSIKVKLIRWEGSVEMPGKANRTGQVRAKDGYEIEYLPRLRHMRVLWTGPLGEDIDPERMVPIERVANWERLTSKAAAKK